MCQIYIYFFLWDKGVKLIGRGLVISVAYPSGAHMETRDQGSDCRGGGGHHVCQEGQQKEKEKGKEGRIKIKEGGIRNKKKSREKEK